MPLYEYECRKCHHRFEEIQKFSDRPIAKCPKCRTGKVVKLISAPAVHFKGSGWYVNDYGKGTSGKQGKDDKGGKSDSSEKSEKSEKSESRDKGESSSKGGKDSKADTGKKSSGKD